MNNYNLPPITQKMRRGYIWFYFLTIFLLTSSFIFAVFKITSENSFDLILITIILVVILPFFVIVWTISSMLSLAFLNKTSPISLSKEGIHYQLFDYWIHRKFSPWKNVVEIVESSWPGPLSSKVTVIYLRTNSFQKKLSKLLYYFGLSPNIILISSLIEDYEELILNINEKINNN